MSLYRHISIKKREILIGLYEEAMGISSRLQILEAEFGHKYTPDQPRVPAGEPDGGQWTGGGGGDSDDSNGNDYAQLAPLLEGVPVTPPLETLPEDSTIPPGPGYEWRGPDAPGGPKGGWYKPDTGETLHPDMNNEKEGPHWDYVDPTGDQWRVWPDGSMTPKVVVGSITA